MTPPKDRPAKTLDLKLYGGLDPRDQARYTYVEAARATGIPATTIAAWVRGQAYRRKADVARFHPVIRRPDSKDSRLSFNNLIEVHVLRALRETHEVRLSYIRHAIGLAEKSYKIQRLLISPELRTSGGALFLDRYFELVELSVTEQFAMRSIMKEYLARFDLDERHLPAEFFPLSRTPSRAGQRLLRLSPFIAFGQTVVSTVGVTTHAIAERVNAGEDKSLVMSDYGLSEPEFEEALLYEAAA